MAARPVRRAVIAALTSRASTVLGPSSSALDYVVAWISAGGTFTTLATCLGDQIGRSLSRGFVSFTCQRLAPDARSRIRSARERAGPGGASRTRSGSNPLAAGQEVIHVS